MDETSWSIPHQALCCDADTLPICSLSEVLQDWADGRRAQGKCSSLALIVCLLILAKLAGPVTLSAATEWLGHPVVSLSQQCGLARATMPYQNTSRYVLACIDGHHLDELLAAFLARWEAQSRCGKEPSRLQTPEMQADHCHLAIDGKTMRATTKEEHLVHQLNCSEVATGTVLWHGNVQEKENEISALKPLLNRACVTGRMLTLDVMQTQRDLCAPVHRLAGDSILIASENPPTRRVESADLLEDRPPDRRRWQQAETWDKAHGRLEHRQIIWIPDLNDWFGKPWEGIEQVVRLERTACLLKTGQVRHEVVYGLSSLFVQQAPLACFLTLIRDHWAIEHRLHHRRDVS